MKTKFLMIILPLLVITQAIFLISCDNLLAPEDLNNIEGETQQPASSPSDKSPEPQPAPPDDLFIQAQGNTVAEQLEWVQANAQSYGFYNVRAVLENEIITNSHLIFYENRTNVTVRIQGEGNGSLLSLDKPIGPMFEVADNNVTLILQNITLRGHHNNSFPLVFVCLGTLEMGNNSAITGNMTKSASGGGIFADRGTVNMRENARIYNNRAISGGGIELYNSTVTMRDNATIDNNSTYSNGGHGGGVSIGYESGLYMYDNAAIRNNIAHFNGGGVHLRSENSSLNMHGNNVQISGNSALGNFAKGGGVHIEMRGFINISGGVIYGANAEPALANTASERGAALCLTEGEAKVRLGSYNSASGFTPSGVVFKSPFESNSTFRVIDGAL